MTLFLTPKNKFYPEFLAHLFKDTDLLKIDECLSYQLEKYYADDFPAFSRLLKLMLQKFEGGIIPGTTATTIQEWIVIKTSEQEKEGEFGDSGLTARKRGRINRRADDNITTLNREQTILLIHYLKEASVFLKDEYLTDLDAGKAFELLTGYSQNTLRQDLGKFYQFQNNENLKKLHQVFSHIIRLIEVQQRK